MGLRIRKENWDRGRYTSFGVISYSSRRATVRSWCQPGWYFEDAICAQAMSKTFLLYQSFYLFPSSLGAVLDVPEADPAPDSQLHRRSEVAPQDP